MKRKEKEEALSGAFWFYSIVCKVTEREREIETFFLPLPFACRLQHTHSHTQEPILVVLRSISHVIAISRTINYEKYFPLPHSPTHPPLTPLTIVSFSHSLRPTRSTQVLLVLLSFFYSSVSRLHYYSSHNGYRRPVPSFSAAFVVIVSDCCCYRCCI